MAPEERCNAELIAALCDETILPDEMRRLDRLLCTDAEVRRLYLEYLDVHARLSYQFHQPVSGSDRPAEDADAAKIVPSFRISSFAPLHGSVAGAVLSYSLAAIVLCLGVFAVGAWRATEEASPLAAVPGQPPIQPVADAEQASPGEVVGAVTALKDCRWPDPGSALRKGADVVVGQTCKLTSGLLEITYRSGAKVTLEGAARYRVESAYRGFLSLGTATVRAGTAAELQKSQPRSPDVAGRGSLELLPTVAVPRPRLPFFSLRTPSANLIEQGACFTVQVTQSGVSYTHVVRGNAALYLPELPGRARGKLIPLMEDDWGIVEMYADQRGRNVNLGTGNQPATWAYARKAPKEVPVCSVDNQEKQGGNRKTHN
jgi:hypothetical protein